MAAKRKTPKSSTKGRPANLTLGLPGKEKKPETKIERKAQTPKPGRTKKPQNYEQGGGM